ncbi:hypothetical protein DMUE_1197 [Dictyocoela muelleri]|nr:hypothetical protein DMUE_1197 [Dictyocoela muelleri]
MEILEKIITEYKEQMQKLTWLFEITKSYNSIFRTTVEILLKCTQIPRVNTWDMNVIESVDLAIKRYNSLLKLNQELITDINQFMKSKIGEELQRLKNKNESELESYTIKIELSKKLHLEALKGKYDEWFTGYFLKQDIKMYYDHVEKQNSEINHIKKYFREQLDELDLECQFLIKRLCDIQNVWMSMIKTKNDHKDEYKDNYKDEYKDNYKDEYKDNYKDEYKDDYNDEYKDNYKDEYKDVNNLNRTINNCCINLNKFEIKSDTNLIINSSLIWNKANNKPKKYKIKIENNVFQNKELTITQKINKTYDDIIQEILVKHNLKPCNDYLIVKCGFFKVKKGFYDWKPVFIIHTKTHIHFYDCKIDQNKNSNFNNHGKKFDLNFIADELIQNLKRENFLDHEFNVDLQRDKLKFVNNEIVFIKNSNGILGFLVDFNIRIKEYIRGELEELYDSLLKTCLNYGNKNFF